MNKNTPQFIFLIGVCIPEPDKVARGGGAKMCSGLRPAFDAPRLTLLGTIYGKIEQMTQMIDAALISWTTFHRARG